MAEDSGIWANSGVGDASPHTLAETAKFMGILAGVAGGGVVPDYLNELTPAVNGSNVEVGTGAAVVDGHPYLNDALRSITPTTPSTGTTGRRIVARANWAAQTVRLVEISSADGTATIPSVTQTPGTTYDLPICSYTVTTGGVIGSFLDTRTFSRTPMTVVKRKSADETVNGSATVQDDNDLFFAIAAGETWVCEFHLSITTGATPDFKFAITVPGGATVTYSVIALSGPNHSVPNTMRATASGTEITLLSVPGAIEALVRAVVVNGATAGNVQLRWAQNTSDASNTVVEDGSWLRAERLVA